VGEAPAFALAERGGLALAVAAFVSRSPHFSLGLSYEHVGLGRERGGDADPDWVDVARALDALWASVEAHLASAPRVRLSLLIGVGLVWQHADVSAVLSQGVGRPLLPIQCSGSDAANFGFRAGLGAEFVIGNGVSFVADALVDNIRLSTDPLDGCVLGAGTTTLLSARAGFAYRFDPIRL
jgi:hypothetical protein